MTMPEAPRPAKILIQEEMALPGWTLLGEQPDRGKIAANFSVQPYGPTASCSPTSAER